MRTISRSALLLLGLATAGCMSGPLNGASFLGNVFFKSVTFEGYFHEPNTQIRIDVMTDPTLNPGLSASWVQLAVATTDSTPITYDTNSPNNPLYHWTVSAVPVPNVAAAARWPQGGLLRVRAVAPSLNNRVLTTFDNNTFFDCMGEQLAAGGDWVQVGMACEGLGGTNAAYVSETGTPTPVGGFLSKKGQISVAQTNQYYQAIDAPASLTEFKTRYGFGTGITATYYNDGDLGLGREMHCAAYVSPLGLGVGPGVACYVTNYSGTDGQAVFDGNVNTSLADAVARQHSFATVAMVYRPPFGSVNSVQFMVYGANGALSPTAALDSTGQATSVPTNCMSCHGINSHYTPGTNTDDPLVSGAQFLPFDPFSYKFSTQAGFTFAAQAGAFRQLNHLVLLTQPSPGILEFIAGLYAPKLVTDPTAVANPDYVPADWTNAFEGIKGKSVYDGVVKVGCRTCHMSATNPSLDFADASDFTGLIGTIKADVCGSAHVMPHAERVMKRFWESGARAYLITAFPPASFPDPYGACKP